MKFDDKLTALQAISRDGGGFAMMALDGRESFRGILRDNEQPHEDADLSATKAMIARQLGPIVSAVLCDTVTGLEAIEVMQAELPDTGLIIAVDHFDEPQYGPLMNSTLDLPAMRPAVERGGVSALKLYVFWRPEETPQAREAGCRAFVDECAELGVLSLLEGVITMPADDPDFDDALVRAAEEFGAFAPDIYKTQLPTLGRADLDTIERESARVSAAVGVPWVALSNGVPSERFAEAVGAVGRGGGSGYLAGRGSWRASLQAADPAADLATTGRARMTELVDMVDRYARPWSDIVRPSES